MDLKKTQAISSQVKEPLVDSNGFVTRAWLKWFQQFPTQVGQLTGLAQTAWGNINGILSDQNDLQSALNAKLSISNVVPQVNSDWNATTGVEKILNKPTIPAAGITALTGDVVASGPGSASATLANTAVTVGSYASPNITVDAKGRITAAANSTVALVSSVPGKPAAGQEVMIYVADRNLTIPANFAGSVGGFGPSGAFPSSSVSYTVKLFHSGAWTTVGTVTVSSAGVFSFATTGGVLFSVVSSDVLSILAPAVQDTVLASVSMTIQALRV